MKTVQMTIDSDLLEDVDAAVASVGTTRSAFIRKALEKALHELKIQRMEQRQIAGYIAYPETESEAAEWEEEQVWPE